MVALSKSDVDWAWPETAPADQSAAAFLNHLRFVALGCRAKARADLFEACALLSIDPNQSFRAHAEALILCLNDALSKRAVLFRPGTQEQSFDEAWILQLAVALANRNDDTIAFLLRSRVAREHHRNICFLVSRISEQFTLT